MKLWSVASASCRRRVVSFSVAAVLGSATVAFAQAAPAAGQAPAQAPAAGQAQAAPAAQADPFLFTTPAGGIIWSVKADKTADFEAVWTAIRSKLAAGTPDQQALNTSLKIYKLDADAPGQDATYLFMTDPASKTVSLSPSPYLLFTSKLFTDAEGRDLYTKLSGAIDKISPMPLSKVQ